MKPERIVIAGGGAAGFFAAAAGAERRTGVFERIDRDADGVARVRYRPNGDRDPDRLEGVRARMIIGADGARSKVASQTLKGADGQVFQSFYVANYGVNLTGSAHTSPPSYVCTP